MKDTGERSRELVPHVDDEARYDEDREAAFITYLVEQQGRNYTQAAIRAGYPDSPSIRVTASRLAKRPNVRAAMREFYTQLRARREEAEYILTLQMRGELPTKTTRETTVVIEEDGERELPGERVQRQYDTFSASKTVASLDEAPPEKKLSIFGNYNILLERD